MLHHTLVSESIVVIFLSISTSYCVLALDEEVQNILAHHVKVLIQEFVDLHHKSFKTIAN